MITLNGHRITPTIFPDKTSQVWKVFQEDSLSLHVPELKVVWTFENEAELIHLSQLKMLLDNVCPKAYKVLHLPYLPYARQDKQVSDIATFALSTFARHLNLMSWDIVSVFDPHSNVEKLIDNVYQIQPVHEINRAVAKFEPDVIAFPDGGAQLRYDYPALRKKYVIGIKERDQLTGFIKSYRFEGDTVEGKNVLMVDDLCDGGATFVLLAQSLYDRGAKNVGLYVSHGIFSKGLEPLHKAGIRDIYVKGERV